MMPDPHMCRFGRGYHHEHTRVMLGSTAAIILLGAGLLASTWAFGLNRFGLGFFSLNMILSGLVLYGNCTRNRYFYWAAIIVGRMYVILAFVMLTFLLGWFFFAQYDVFEKMGYDPHPTNDMKFDLVTYERYDKHDPRVNARRIRLLTSMLVLVLSFWPVYWLHRALAVIELDYEWMQLNEKIEAATPEPHYGEQEQSQVV